jgi:hypothetical protein
MPSIILGDFNYKFASYPSNSITPDIIQQQLRFYSQNPSPIPTLDPLPDTEISPMEIDPDPPVITQPNHTIRPQWIWHALLLRHYQECTHRLRDQPFYPTFRQSTACTIIDYIFANLLMSPFVKSSSIEFLSSQWTDHALLAVKIFIPIGKHTLFSFQERESYTEKVLPPSFVVLRITMLSDVEKMYLLVLIWMKIYTKTMKKKSMNYQKCAFHTLIMFLVA